jgi:hypothetical protein
VLSFVFGLGAIGMALYAAVVWVADPWTDVGLLLIALAGVAGLFTGVGLWRVARWTHKSLLAFFGLLASVSWIAQAIAGAALVYCVLSAGATVLIGLLVTWHVYLRTNVAA